MKRIKLPPNGMTIPGMGVGGEGRRRLQKHHRYYPELRPESEDDINRRTAVFENEIEALERKLFLEDIAVDVADERCDFLGKNLSLLQQNEVNLRWQCSTDESNLEALRVKHEAVQFSLYQKANPIEKWTVKSLPNLHIYFSSM
ncbi:uncharacterized protein [Montipora capricornis]|uniref:uncharacterized protein n=1 Tax=Montipora capricornis TaxID=246305 RepID=UPI0035F12057